MKWGKIIFLVAVLSSCSSVRFIKNEAEGLQYKRVISHPGQVELVTWEGVTFEKNSSPQKLRCGTEEIPLVWENQSAFALIPVSYWEKEKFVSCYIKKDQKVLDLDIVDFKFPSARIKVDKRRVFLSKKDQARVEQERKMLEGIYAQVDDHHLFQQPFGLPLESVVTSPYGEKRLFNNKKESWHLGIDFRAKVSTPIASTNSGKVVFAGDLFYTGMTIVISHGLGLYSMYGHLKELKVSTGDLVQKGDIIALSGNTGRSSAPHLHWGVKLHTHWVSGFSLINASYYLPSKGESLK